MDLHTYFEAQKRRIAQPKNGVVECLVEKVA
jgi:hypothetical protein